ncbi:unnamed protein product, partial [Rotaria magnacalcarata]
PKRALDYYKQALNLYKDCLPDGHENQIDLEINIERLTKEMPA